jgi:hypothetical protein
MQYGTVNIAFNNNNNIGKEIPTKSTKEKTRQSTTIGLLLIMLQAM